MTFVHICSHLPNLHSPPPPPPKKKMRFGFKLSKKIHVPPSPAIFVKNSLTPPPAGQGYPRITIYINFTSMCLWCLVTFNTNRLICLEVDEGTTPRTAAKDTFRTGWFADYENWYTTTNIAWRLHINLSSFRGEIL